MALELTDQRLINTILSQSVHAIVISDLEGNLEYVNPAFLSLWGYQHLDEVIGQNSLKFTDEVEKTKHILSEILTHSEWKGELTAKRKDGSTFDIAVTAYSSKDKQGNITHLLASFSDLTKTKELEQYQKEREIYFSQILDSITDLVFCKDKNFKVTYANKACADFYGVSKQELIGIQDVDYNKNEYTNAYHLEDKKVFDTGITSYIRKEPNINKNNITRIFETVKNPIRDGQGSIKEIVGVSRDITETLVLEDRLQLVTELTSDYIYTAKITSGEVIAEWSSKELTTTSGYSIEEIGKLGGWFNIILKEDLTNLAERMTKILKGETGVVEYRIRTKSGKIKWLRDYTRPIPGGDGKITSIIGAVKDITIEKETELKYLSSSQRYQAAMKSALEAIYFLAASKNKDGEIIDFIISDVNEKAEEQLGMKKEELLGKGICQLFPVNRENGFFEKYKEVAETKVALEEEFQIPGSYVAPGYYYHQVIPTNDGIVIQNRDISDRKRMEELLLRTNRLAKVGSFDYDLTKKQITLSIVATEILVQSSHHIEGVDLSFFGIEEFSSIIKQKEIHCIKTKENFDLECLVRAGSEFEFWIRIIATPKFLENTCIGFYGAIQNIHDQKLIQDSLLEKETLLLAQNKELESLVQITKKQNERLKEYTYITSHNLRAPIANLISLTTMLKETPTNMELLGLIESSSYQLDQIIRNLNELLNIEKDTKELPKSKILIKESIDSQLLLLKNGANREIEFINQIPEEIKLLGFQAYFDSIVSNILSNAIKYSNPNQVCKISVSHEETKDLLKIAISDNGTGIDINRHGTKLFKMNFRLRQDVEGKGMGLFLAKHQIEAMNGSVEVKSELGKGSTFVLTFPKVLL
ncbi:PAS domain S-box protein [Leptospira sp. 2 VSF19]|uniref:histidine kinase n=1 Tax=Leptospira soteropolitanensis TaxID=2950025 RepID=A0AAW5VEX0_9LEPT|nr:PAS domain S-box protein [Leptospira soteropolitanensis]MCW7492389.1 PAS domain S-box protein [Leptospira soteropolitanensis]MCW7499969.1 PAS domain S-box protein [Leptospira soteropolitanensis]MCW7522221.1 PAS domain S-box protein [Leptospira soteropolitanensis]MCW7526076.1 PAS domain S-box protein [Leptospira soteropolitanensis]MCW7529812.1 PAS domain S-box protein [Leptospira soteropolitanensis]